MLNDEELRSVRVFFSREDIYPMIVRRRNKIQQQEDEEQQHRLARDRRCIGQR